ncbi:hypothetical protein [Mycobacterium intracellulare]|uniref:Uncharacterized protein n=1 Tax=Mycobacterium intracellulare TaxID=1767 RepID=A0A7R7MY61_MYCIT|nr:hypothetical protein [Mycobacterium intracellulare]BCP00687.1 hypothetical protein MINTM018_34560 [Mycobacterium intracellulare]
MATAPASDYVTAPPDATDMRDWSHLDGGLATRVFAGNTREAAGFTVRVGGLQRSNSTCRRWVVVESTSSIGVPLEPEAVRQFAAALVAAADEIEARR